MLTETEMRAFDLAVSRFGVTPSRVKEVANSLTERRARGEAADLFQLLATEKILARASGRCSPSAACR